MVDGNVLSQFDGARVFVTGHTGFKGSWLCLWLHLLGADVMGYALPPLRAHDHFNLVELASLIRHVEGDVRDLPHLAKACRDFRPDFLFHLAAQPLVRESYEDPKGTFDTNVGGTVNVLEAVRASDSLRAAVIVTSDKCYRNREWVWGYRECDELGGRDPYSASKAAAEMVFSSYLDSFFAARERFGIASVRAGNVIGGGDWSDHRIVPDCIRALRARQPVTLRNPRSTRPWLHVLEPLRGYLTLAVRLAEEPGTYSGSWNFGPSGEAIRTVQELAQLIVRHWGEGEVAVDGGEDRRHEAGLLHLCIDKSRQRLGWRPAWDFGRSVQETVNWYREMHDGSPMLPVSTAQIQRYQEETDD